MVKPLHLEMSPRRKIFRHISWWLEVYMWLPISLISIWLSAKFAYFLTGRTPQESADWIPEFAQRTVACILVVALVSITRQQTGFWITKEEALANPKIALLQAASKCFFAGLFAYILLH